MRPQPRMQDKKAYEHSHHGHTGYTRHSLRNGFNGLLRALLGDRALLPPSSSGKSARLDASVGASGPHDFAVRISTIRPSACDRLRSRFAHDAAASIAAPANVRDDRETPLCMGTG